MTLADTAMRMGEDSQGPTSRYRATRSEGGSK